MLPSPVDEMMPVKLYTLRTRVFLPLTLLLCLALLLAGCFGPKTPQAVAKAFWQAVIAHDTDAVVQYSTLTEPQAFNGFGMDWKGLKPAWGKVIINGDQASIETRFNGPVSSETAQRQYVTYLVRKNGVWKVDYTRTGDDLRGGAIGNLFGRLGQLGDSLSKTFDDSAKALSGEMQRLGRKLQDMSDQFSQQASGIIDKHARELQRIMRQLQDSINRALQDKKNHPSDQERQAMTQVADHLHESSAALDSPTTKSVTHCNDTMMHVQQRLNSIDNGISDDYKNQWRDLTRQFQTVLHKMTDQLANSVNDNPPSR